MKWILSPLILASQLSAGSFIVRGDYLLFKPELDNLVLSVNADVNYKPHSTPISGDTKIRPFDTKWQSAFRVGIGYEQSCSEWVIGADWTHFDTNNSGSDSALSTTNGGGTIVGTNILAPVNIFDSQEGAISPNKSSVMGRWCMHLDDASIRFGKEFCCSHSFYLTPFFGVRGLSLRQTLDEVYLVEVSGIGSINSFGKAKSSFYALGVTGGLRGEFVCFKDFGLYGFVEASLLYGRYKTDTAVDTKVVLTGDILFGRGIDDLKQPFNALRPVVDAGFGIQWKSSCGPLSTLILRLGWEGHSYFEQNSFLKYRTIQGFTGDISAPRGVLNEGNLTLMGGVFSLTVAF